MKMSLRQCSICRKWIAPSVKENPQFTQGGPKLRVTSVTQMLGRCSLTNTLTKAQSSICDQFEEKD